MARSTRNLGESFVDDSDPEIHRSRTPTRLRTTTRTTSFGDEALSPLGTTAAPATSPTARSRSPKHPTRPTAPSSYTFTPVTSPSLPSRPPSFRSIPTPSKLVCSFSTRTSPRGHHSPTPFRRSPSTASLTSSRSPPTASSLSRNSNHRSPCPTPLVSSSRLSAFTIMRGDPAGFRRRALEGGEGERGNEGGRGEGQGARVAGGGTSVR